MNIQLIYNVHVPSNVVQLSSNDTDQHTDSTGTVRLHMYTCIHVGTVMHNVLTYGVVIKTRL